jgi:hypothetical protein
LLVNPGEVHDGRPSGDRGRRHSMLEIDVDVYSQISADVGCEGAEFERPASSRFRIRHHSERRERRRHDRELAEPL